MKEIAPLCLSSITATTFASVSIKQFIEINALAIKQLQGTQLIANLDVNGKVCCLLFCR
jgi:hypothetical protein